MYQHRLHQSHSCPLAATRKLEVLLPFDEVTILGRTCPHCRLQADGSSEGSLSSLPTSKLPGVVGRDLDFSSPLGTRMLSITSREDLVTLSKGL